MTDQNEAVNASQTIPTSERLQVARDKAVKAVAYLDAQERATLIARADRYRQLCEEQRAKGLLGSNFIHKLIRDLRDALEAAPL